MIVITEIDKYRDYNQLATIHKAISEIYSQLATLENTKECATPFIQDKIDKEINNLKKVLRYLETGEME